VQPDVSLHGPVFERLLRGVRHERCSITSREERADLGDRRSGSKIDVTAKPAHPSEKNLIMNSYIV
jgi:hypothetical protein